jgi:hypothetical protein
MKRLRGVLLRTAYARRMAVAIGALLLALAAWTWLADFSWESAATDGLALVFSATGVAFVVAGLQGRRPDWTE